MLHPESARDLLLAQGGDAQKPGRDGTREASNGEVRIPASLRWAGLEQGPGTRGQQRGVLGNVLLSAVEIVTGISKAPAADFAASEVVRRVDAQVDAGVYRAFG